MISCWMPWERSISRRVLEPLKSIYHKIKFFHQSNPAFYAPIFLLTDKSQYLKIVVHDGSVVMKDFVTYQSWSRHLKITQRWKRFQNYHSLEQAFGRRFNCNRHLAFKLHLKETILTTQFCLKNVARTLLIWAALAPVWGSGPSWGGSPSSPPMSIDWEEQARWIRCSGRANHCSLPSAVEVLLGKGLEPRTLVGECWSRRSLSSCARTF